MILASSTTVGVWDLVGLALAFAALVTAATLVIIKHDHALSELLFGEH